MTRYTFRASRVLPWLDLHAKNTRIREIRAPGVWSGPYLALPYGKRQRKNDTEIAETEKDSIPTVRGHGFRVSMFVFRDAPPWP